MTEINFSTNQLEDSVGTIYEAVESAFAAEAKSTLYRPDEIVVPRPSFAMLSMHLQEVSANVTFNPRCVIAPNQAEVLTDFAGLRGAARTRVQTSSGAKTLAGPAIVLPGGRQVAMLTAEQQADRITDMQHALLDGEYAKFFAKVRAEHGTQDVQNAAEIGAALMIASSVGGANAHHDLHGVARRHGATFGTKFNDAGRQDLQVGQRTRAVRSLVLPTNRVVLDVAAHDQLPPDVSPLDLNVSAHELVVGMTLAATASRGGRPNLVANLHNMVGE